MSWHVLKSTLYQRRTALLWYAVGLVSYSVMIVWYFPSLSKVNLEELLTSFPPEMLDFFAGSAVDMGTFGGYLAVEYLGFMWVLIMAAAAITFATKCLSGEVAAGTMELVLSQPVGRRTIVITRWVAMAAYLFVLMLATTVPIWLTAHALDIAVDAGNIVLLTVVGFLLSLAIGSLAFALSSVSSESGRPAGIVGGVLGAMWVVSFMSENAKWAEALNPVNLFHYWEPARLLEEGTASAGAWWFFGALSVIGLVAAVLGFAKRDIA